MWGFFTVLGKKLTDELGALRLTSLVTLLGAAYMLPLGWIELELTGRSLSDIAPLGWMAIAFLGVGCCFLAVLLYFVALEHSESQKVGVYLYTIPPMTALVAALFLGETLSWNLLLGSLLVYAGVYLTERQPAAGDPIMPLQPESPGHQRL
jgi:drug/metabolite transporter (DMT)-like permease